ncbi:MAG TPA: leucyl/phenylalanyl-tRNA--protein transferase [Methylophaga aminisulfidivorans]|uniref:Leucyl/phenylalanyl-tRNA--protein transferase n=1 Tax=Methylophaga aminisulfidivorans TaxID=230105 RepID=A0A7C1ZQK0_9GAMM|nr:leucyl/phenylalanyl-tRNA--protein transferase [Methylophaga aminisulfidivorans]
MGIVWLNDENKSQFPDVSLATAQGLLAAGGDLSAQRLLHAYRRGIFPWFNKHDPILWWCPDPRMVLYTDNVKVSKSLKKTLRKNQFKVTLDTSFEQVMLACSAPRSDGMDAEHATWIHDNMIKAYTELYQQGHAHSVECWQNDVLVGGLYGVAIGHMFFGESMFSKVSDSSKVALVCLCQQLERWNISMIDCQIYSDHLASLGAEEIPRAWFIEHLETSCNETLLPQKWQLDLDLPNTL